MKDNVASHGLGQRLLMLIRAILNAVVLVALCFAIVSGKTVFIIIGVALFALCFICNLVVPFIHRKK